MSRKPYIITSDHSDTCTNKACRATIRANDLVLFDSLNHVLLCPACTAQYQRDLAAADFDERGY